MLNYYYAKLYISKCPIPKNSKFFYLCTLNNMWNMSSFFFLLDDSIYIASNDIL